MVFKYQTKCQNHTAEYNPWQCTKADRQRNILPLMHRYFLKARYSFFNSHTFILTYTVKDCISQRLFYVCNIHSHTLHSGPNISATEQPASTKQKAPGHRCRMLVELHFPIRHDIYPRVPPLNCKDRSTGRSGTITNEPLQGSLPHTATAPDY